MKDRIMEKLAKVKILDFIRPTKATGLTRSIYQSAENELGLSAEPLLIHSIDTPLLEAFYTLGREVLLVKSEVSRAAKDAIATVVSHSNKCQYCVDTHAMSIGAEGDSELMKALETNDLTKIKEHPLFTTITWFHETNSSIHPKLSAVALSEYLSVYLYFHYTNRMVNMFVSASHIPKNRWSKFYKKVGTWYLSKFTSKQLQPGTYKAEPLAIKLKGIAAETTVQNRLSHISDTLDKRIAAILSPKAILTAKNFIEKWDGQPVPMGRWWVENEIQEIDGGDRSFVRYILLFSLAGFTLSDEEVLDLKGRIGSLKLLHLSTWGAFKVASRLTEIKYNQFHKTEDHEILQQHVS